MDSGNNNPKQLNNQLPVATNTSIQKLSNLIQLSEDVLRECEPEYWFEKALIDKGNSRWQGVIYHSSKALNIKPNYSLSYLLRAYANYKLANPSNSSSDLVSFFTKDYILNQTNCRHFKYTPNECCHSIITRDEWLEILSYFENQNYQTDELINLSRFISKYYSGQTEQIRIEKIPSVFGNTYLQWGYLLAGLLSDIGWEEGQGDPDDRWKDVNYFDKAIELYPDFSACCWEKYINVRYIEDEYSHIRRIIQIEPHNAPNILEVVSLNLHNGADVLPLELTRYLKKKNETISLAFAFWLLDVVYSKVSVDDTYYETILSIMGKDTPEYLYIERGFGKIGEGLYEEGMKDLDLVMDGNGWMVEHYERGVIRVKHKDYIGAIQDFTISHNLHISNHGCILPLYLFARGKAKKAINELQGALEDIKQANKIETSEEHELLLAEIENRISKERLK